MTPSGDNQPHPGQAERDDAGQLAALLDWMAAMGADEAIAEAPVKRFGLEAEAEAKAGPAAQTATQAPETTAAVAPPPPSPAQAAPASGKPAAIALPVAAEAQKAAAACNNLDELRAGLERFDGCDLKKTAMNLVFADGAPQARVMIIGEAPGRDEDMEGRPFAGREGQLMDRMLGAIGLDRTSTRLASCIFWRPPGNRKPTDNEIAACLPFLARHIELVSPEILVLSGNLAAKILLGSTAGITRLRGTWSEWTSPNGKTIPAITMLPPSFLLHTPQAKREAWRDLLALKAWLEAAKG